MRQKVRIIGMEVGLRVGEWVKNRCVSGEQLVYDYDIERRGKRKRLGVIISVVFLEGYFIGFGKK